ncbi:MAG: hypothetical protein LBJ97_02810 [Mycoplasmataceae bacterium]|jgi:tRNA U55 pseudouridine synthase TruB|nr:hypothetical protein [Mycoplasmataceae bacterium]
MSVTKKIALAAVIYIGYQLFTNKKYDDLRRTIFKEFEKTKPKIIETLDDVHTYLTVPKDASDETFRIKIDKEIQLLKDKIKNIDTAKVANKANKIIETTNDAVSKSLNNLRKRK